jgi:hypothetical protein
MEAAAAGLVQVVHLEPRIDSSLLQSVYPRQEDLGRNRANIARLLKSWFGAVLGISRTKWPQRNMTFRSSTARSGARYQVYPSMLRKQPYRYLELGNLTRRERAKAQCQKIADSLEIKVFECLGLHRRYYNGIGIHVTINIPFLTFDTVNDFASEVSKVCGLVRIESALTMVEASTAKCVVSDASNTSPQFKTTGPSGLGNGVMSRTNTKATPPP